MRHFRLLLREELWKAAPRLGGTAPQPWHKHLSRRFTHETIVREAGGNTDFLLSLKPELVYVLSQMWISFDKGTKNESSQHAEQWIWYLGKTCLLVDSKRGEDSLVEKVWRPWRNLVQAEYPDLQLKEKPCPHDSVVCGRMRWLKSRWRTAKAA